MERQLQEYYEARLLMFSGKGWKDFIEDVDLMLRASSDISSIPDEKTLQFRKGELSILRWLKSIEQLSKDSYDELK